MFTTSVAHWKFKKSQRGVAVKYIYLHYSSSTWDCMTESFRVNLIKTATSTKDPTDLTFNQWFHLYDKRLAQSWLTDSSCNIFKKSFVGSINILILTWGRIIIYFNDSYMQWLRVGVLKTGEICIKIPSLLSNSGT